MHLEINPRDRKPAYLQIVDQIKMGVASGRLQPRDPLPSIRQLAERLRINRNTVDKAYRELDRQRVIRTERGRGAFIAESNPVDEDGFRDRVLSDVIDRLIAKARAFRVSDDEVLDLVQKRLAGGEASDDLDEQRSRSEGKHAKD
ncbi:MAG: GntR family transcriptional regulator [Acidobacteriota bacterium]